MENNILRPVFCMRAFLRSKNNKKTFKLHSTSLDRLIYMITSRFKALHLATYGILSYFCLTDKGKVA